MYEAPPPPPPPDHTGIPRRVPARSFRFIAIALLVSLSIILATIGFWLVTQPDVVPSLWALEMTQVDSLQGDGLDGTGVRVCIVDTGIDPLHPDFRDLNIVGWRDFVGGQSRPYDDRGHGTAMAGIIFARGRLRGVAPGADLIVAKAITASGSGSDRDVADAIDFCTDPNGDRDASDGAHVISLSLGGYSHPILWTQTEDAVNRAFTLGALVVAAAGNDGEADDGDVESPASVERVIAVGAVDSSRTIASFSSEGAPAGGIPPRPREDPNRKPELSAPGVLIATTSSGGSYALVSGTSPSAAFVSGIVALLLERHEQYKRNPAGIQPFKEALMRGALAANAQDVPHDPHYGYGIARAVATSEILSR